MSRGIIGGSNIPSYHEADGVNVKCQGGFQCSFCGIGNWTETHQSYLLGKVLTMIDATITNGAQNKAMKDIVKTNFYAEFESLDKRLKHMLACDDRFKDLILKNIGQMEVGYVDQPSIEDQKKYSGATETVGQSSIGGIIAG